MLYEGKTVHDALAQALGKKAMGRKKSKYPSKPSTYGKPIRGPIKTPSAGKVGTKPSNVGKQQEEEGYPFDNPQRIESARQSARALARTFINGADHTARTEDGIMYLYDKQTGLPITIRPSGSSFHHVEFDLGRYRSEIQRYEMLAHAHTHVRSRESNLNGRRIEDRRNRSWSSDDQNYLLNFAPGFLKNPSGDVISGGRSPYRPLSEHPQL